MDMRKLVGRNFGRLRGRKGFTQERFAEVSGFTQQYVSDLERGRRNPTVVTLFHLASALGISHIDLVMPDEEASSERPKAAETENLKTTFPSILTGRMFDLVWSFAKFRRRQARFCSSAYAVIAATVGDSLGACRAGVVDDPATPTAALQPIASPLLLYHSILRPEVRECVRNMSDHRQYAPATLRNRDFILDVLRDVLPIKGEILEIASGSGEHVVHFAESLPSLVFQPSDPDPDALQSVAAWVKATRVTNVRAPIVLDASQSPWPIASADGIICINMVHISPWERRSD